MKTNKEFIEGIYQKAEEISYEKKQKKVNYIRKISDIAAVIIIVIALVININPNKLQENSNQISNVETKQISLKTINTFENFCSYIKNSSIDTGKLSYSDGLVLESANTATDSVYYKYSTNTQVENVDEADIVKVDKDYIYYVSEKRIIIVNAKNAEESAKVGEINYQDEITPQEIYVSDEKLVVIGRQYQTATAVCGIYDRINVISESKTFLIIYDISNPSQPKEIRKVEVEGDYISSRMIGKNIYFAINKNIYTSEIKDSEPEILDENKYKPKYKDTVISNEEQCIGFNDIYCFEETETMNYLILGAISLEKNEEVELQTFLGAGTYIYSSEKNMYIAKTKTEYTENYEYIDTSTHILKFSLNNGKIEFKAEGKVEGNINNQFSMDENGEYFRIATTKGRSWNTDESTSNNLYILNDKLETIGKIEGFAVGERIYSVRYVESKAYVVTFKQTDPLFVIDLSQPTNPQILGELKIPGYSTYLHPYDETHIIGFGYDTEEDGTRVKTSGLKMVMFDISDLNNPKELFKTTIGNQYTNSEFIYNHKALLYIKEKNIIAFPISTYEKNGSSSRASIYEIDLEKGFLLRGEIEHKYNDYKSRVERIVYVNDSYYTLSKSMIKVTNMEILQVVKEIEI